jgi:hypothetical protein
VRGLVFQPPDDGAHDEVNEMSGSTNAAARISAASRDDLTSEELNQLLQDEDVSVRAAACRHPRLTWHHAANVVIDDGDGECTRYLYTERGFSMEGPDDPNAPLSFIHRPHAFPAACA